MASAGGHRNAMADLAINRRDVDLASAGSSDEYAPRDSAVDGRNMSADTTGRAHNDLADNTAGDSWNTDLAHPVPPEQAATVNPARCCGTNDDGFINPTRYGRHSFVSRVGGLQKHAAMNRAITGGSVLVMHAPRFDHNVTFNGPVNVRGANPFVALERTMTAAVESGRGLRHQH